MPLKTSASVSSPFSTGPFWACSSPHWTRHQDTPTVREGTTAPIFRSFLWRIYQVPLLPCFPLNHSVDFLSAEFLSLVFTYIHFFSQLFLPGYILIFAHLLLKVAPSFTAFFQPSRISMQSCLWKRNHQISSDTFSRAPTPRDQCHQL